MTNKLPPDIANHLDRPLLRRDANYLRNAAKASGVKLQWRRYDLTLQQWIDDPPTQRPTGPQKAQG